MTDTTISTMIQSNTVLTITGMASGTGKNMGVNVTHMVMIMAVGMGIGATINAITARVITRATRVIVIYLAIMTMIITGALCFATLTNGLSGNQYCHG